MTTALEGSEGSVSRPGRFLPPGKMRYPLYSRLVGPQGRSGRVRKISPTPGFDPRTVQPVASRYTDYADTFVAGEQRNSPILFLNSTLDKSEWSRLPLPPPYPSWASPQHPLTCEVPILFIRNGESVLVTATKPSGRMEVISPRILKLSIRWTTVVNLKDCLLGISPASEY
jgi:hypothetical protein